MSYKVNDHLANDALDGLAAGLAGGFLTLFAGPAPDAPDDALDMVNDHTALVVISLDGAGVTGLTFDLAAGGTLSKATAEAWSGVATFSGAGAAETELAATFFRFCAAGDDGRGAGAGPRLQGTIGTTGSGADMERDSVSIAASESVSIGAFAVGVGVIL